MWQLLIKVYKHLPCGSAIPLPVFFPKEMETYLTKKSHPAVFTEALLVGMETPGYIGCSRREWISALWYLHKMEYYTAIKRNGH